MISLYNVIILSLALVVVTAAKYKPTWDSIDSRPLPSWYDEAKLGIFVHWGVFSVPSYGSEWFWWNWQGTKRQEYIDFMKNNYPPDFTYPDFGPMFKAELFNPEEWAEIFQASGAKYVVLTSKHHEGFTNWPSKYSWNWNAMDIGPHRDLVGELAKSIRQNTSIVFGLYHSLFEWFNPLYIGDKDSGFKTDEYVQKVTLPELYEIINNYKPEVVWSDGDWEAKSTYWNSTGFLAWLYNESPVKDTVVTNDRWGSDTNCKHGGYYTCQDRYNPGKLVNHKWENCMTIDKHSWGYRRNSQLADYLTMHEIITLLVETVSCGGNLLINVGPTADGRILPVFEERLRELGEWMKVNGEGIYATKPWRVQNDTLAPQLWYTSTLKAVYAVTLVWPKNGELTLASPKPSTATTIKLLGYPTPLKWTTNSSGQIVVTFPTFTPLNLPCEYAWVLKMTNVD
ncbi:alpha-L-fucosidase-like [Anneissia japonica]|uniref:alpha-L-fucosidase-like n=1 Tax=Anneissia japonica TaxID=1529436 RepID=UPI001425851C|nr:alpha-L-fucosidase-like [Anneissia japonica]